MARGRHWTRGRPGDNCSTNARLADSCLRCGRFHRTCNRIWGTWLLKEQWSCAWKILRRHGAVLQVVPARQTGRHWRFYFGLFGQDFRPIILIFICWPCRRQRWFFLILHISYYKHVYRNYFFWRCSCNEAEISIVWRRSGWLRYDGLRVRCATPLCVPQHRLSRHYITTTSALTTAYDNCSIYYASPLSVILTPAPACSRAG